MAQAQQVQYLPMEGQLEVLINNIPIVNASRISIKLSTPISKQKSASIVGIAIGIPDVSGNIKLIPDADGRLVNSKDLALRYQGATGVIVWGTRRYQCSGMFWTDASTDNDPGAGSLDDTVGFEAATFKQIS
jgi:hypothetical protein